VSRLPERALALTALGLSSPLLAVAVMAIWLESGRPIVYRQLRVGRGGEPFEMLKLRTMVAGAESMGPGIAVDEGDPRITRAGAVIRRLSLDELPNLVNVVRGEMALVGPRPTIQTQVDQYTARQRRRLEVRPGITGWAQVNGRASLPWHERIELDVWYVEHRSLRLDLEILLKTLGLLVTGHGIYRGETGGWRPGPVSPVGERPALDAPSDLPRAASPASRRRRIPRAGRRRQWRRRRPSPRGRS
jgi:lipopolysaccharide/colanic/teichoic acid biosynthesis glycosyltransferase